MVIVKSQPIVLFVDDEPEVLSSLRRCFRNEPYLVFTAAGSQEGLAWLERARVDLVVTDERMPEMTGTEFLREVRDRSPGTSRMMLTGYPSQALIGRGLEAGADTFLYKPWDDESLRRAVRRALERGAPISGSEGPFDLGGEGG